MLMVLSLFVYLLNLMFVPCYLNTYLYYKYKVDGGCNNFHIEDDCRKLKIHIFLNIFTGWLPLWNLIVLFINLVVDHEEGCKILDVISKTFNSVSSIASRGIDILADKYYKNHKDR
jgi:hypothetical protein